MYFVGLLIKVGSFWLASQLELARYTTELKPKLRSFKNSNEPSRAELLTSEFERVCELRVFRPALPRSGLGQPAWAHFDPARGLLRCCCFPSLLESSPFCMWAPDVSFSTV
jgi:hypothetical protein